MDPNALKFTKSHEWIEPAGKNRKVGITQFAQEQLGDIVYAEFPPCREVTAGAEVCIIESCKATSPIYAPLPGNLVGFNQELAAKPEIINKDPYGEGWLFQLDVDKDVDTTELMDHAAYQKYCESQ